MTETPRRRSGICRGGPWTGMLLAHQQSIYLVYKMPADRLGTVKDLIDVLGEYRWQDDHWVWHGEPKP